MTIDENLNWKQHIHDIAIKLNRANALLSIIRNYINKLTLRTIYFAIYDSHINYANLIWGQNLHSLSRIIILQKKALRIMNFQSRDSHSSPLSGFQIAICDSRFATRVQVFTNHFSRKTKEIAIQKIKQVQI